MEEFQQPTGRLYKIKTFLKECVRVFKITKKPTTEEFKMIVKVTGLGILLIGVVGFLIQMIWQVIR